MSDNELLLSMLYTHFASTTLRPNALSINFGVIDARIAERSRNDVCFILSVPSDGFSYQDDSLKVDKAVVELELLVKNCHYNPSTHGYEWHGQKQFSLENNDKRINTFLYFKGQKLQDTRIDGGLWDLPPNFSKTDDVTLNKLLCQAIWNNSNRAGIIETIESLLESYK